MSISHHSYSSMSADPYFFVATLYEWNPHTEQCGSPLKIYSDREIYIGRDKRTCQYVVDDPFISNKHVRIYTIIFDRDNPGEVAPLVYAQDVSRNGTLWNNCPMGKGNGGFLLSDGDILTLSSRLHLKFRCQNHHEEYAFDNLQQREMKKFENEYLITKRKLGSGAYGQVHMAIETKTGQQLACKIVDLRALKKTVGELEVRKSKLFTGEMSRSCSGIDSLGSTQLEQNRKMRQYLSKEIREKIKAYEREARILESLCHPNIISLERVIKSGNTIYLFQDLVTAGDLFSFIEYKGGRLSDIEAAVIVRQVLLALDYLHDRNIVHRDLKPDNILMTSLADGCRVVLTDFGCARFVKPKVARMSTVVGTFEYSAPEVVSNQRGYTKAVDLWSLGCVTAVLLTGGSPFRDPVTSMYSEELARRGDLELLEWELNRNNAGKRAKAFVYRLLVLDEAERMDVKEALRHCWFTNPIHKHEFEELYERSIGDWQPRARKGSLLLDLNSFEPMGLGEIEKDRRFSFPIAIGSPCETCTGTSSRSSIELSSSQRHPSTFGSDQVHGEYHDIFSPTLSDPWLPTRNRETNGEIHSVLESTQSPSDVHSATNSPSHESNQELSQRQMPISTAAVADNQADGGNPGLPFPSHQYPNESTIRNAFASKEAFIRPIRDFQLFDDVFEPPYHLQSYGEPSRKRYYASIWSDFEEDEVYEEVNNAITGKSQRLFYGTNVASETEIQCKRAKVVC